MAVVASALCIPGEGKKRTGEKKDTPKVVVKDISTGSQTPATAFPYSVQGVLGGFKPLLKGLVIVATCLAAFTVLIVGATGFVVHILGSCMELDYARNTRGGVSGVVS
jgi:hypothetical protein